MRSLISLQCFATLELGILSQWRMVSSALAGKSMGLLRWIGLLLWEKECRVRTSPNRFVFLHLEDIVFDDVGVTSSLALWPTYYIRPRWKRITLSPAFFFQVTDQRKKMVCWWLQKEIITMGCGVGMRVHANEELLWHYLEPISPSVPSRQTGF